MNFRFAKKKNGQIMLQITVRFPILISRQAISPKIMHSVGQFVDEMAYWGHCFSSILKITM